MRCLSLVALPLLCAVAAALAGAAERDAIPVRAAPASLAVFATREEAAAVLGARDEFVLAASPFDRALRLHAAAPVDEPQFLAYLAGQAREWSAGEAEQVGQALRDVAGRLTGLVARLPLRIQLVKTSDEFEDGAPHTRGAAIMLPEAVVAGPPELLRRILVHEIFHLISRHDPAVRERLYASIGFTPCADLVLPADLARIVVTNPDGPRSVHAIEVLRAATRLAVVPLLVSATGAEQADPRRGIFAQTRLRLLVVERDGPACRPAPGPELLDVRDVTGFVEQIGRNTGNISHPDEILASNFEHLVLGAQRLPDPHVPARMGGVLFRLP